MSIASSLSFKNASHPEEVEVGLWVKGKKPGCRFAYWQKTWFLANQSTVY
jgi:hypothetical protein